MLQASIKFINHRQWVTLLSITDFYSNFIIYYTLTYIVCKNKKTNPLYYIFCKWTKYFVLFPNERKQGILLKIFLLKVKFKKKSILNSCLTSQSTIALQPTNLLSYIPRSRSGGLSSCVLWLESPAYLLFAMLSQIFSVYFFVSEKKCYCKNMQTK